MNLRLPFLFLSGIIFFLSGCISSSLQDKQLTPEELDSTEIFGSVQTTFSITAKLTPSSEDIKNTAYFKLLEEARLNYTESIDVKNINILFNSKEIRILYGYEYFYTASGDVVSKYSISARTANKLDDITNQIVNTFKGDMNVTLALFDFVNIDGKNSVLGRYLVEQMSNYFFQSSNFKILERAQIQGVMKEQNFGMSGFVSDESAASIGNLLGANAVTIGTLTKVGNKISVNIKIVETESGSILSSGSTEIEGVEYIEMYNEIVN